MENTFEDYLKQARIDFCKVASTYTVDEHLKLRTAVDSLLIAYDQATEKALNLPVTGVTLCEHEPVDLNINPILSKCDTCGEMKH